MQNWLSSLNADCDVSEVWDLFLDELKKERDTHEEQTAKTSLEAPQMTGTNLEVYLQSFDDFLYNNTHL